MSRKRKTPPDDLASTNDDTSSSYESKPHPYKINHLKLEDPEYISEVPKHLQNQEIPGFPSTILTVGGPGSGKTNVLMNFLTRKDLMCGFFDKIYLLGPTVKADKHFKMIDIPQDQIVDKADEFIPKLKEWVGEQVEKVKTDPKGAPKALFVFEDITSYDQSVQRDPEFAKCFNAIRHHKATAWANVHKFKAMNRTARMCCMHVLVWRVNNSEIKQIYEDYGPHNLDSHDFQNMCYDVWRPDPKGTINGSQKPFLYINKYKEEEERYRRCLTQIIPLEHYEGSHRRNKKKAKLKDDLILKTDTKLPSNLEDKKPQRPSTSVESASSAQNYSSSSSSSSAGLQQLSQTYTDSLYKTANAFAYLH